MRSISKWLVPGFLRRLDKYLLERYPVIWYSGAHWVLFYGLLGTVLLFSAGLLYPVHWVKRELVNDKYMNLDHWAVDPIKPIEFAYDGLYVSPLLLIVAFACIWMYRQFQNRPFFYQVQHSLFCLLIYVGCWWVLCGFTATAFRMGTIVKTAWIWMPEQDLQDFKQSGIYPYGFVLLPEDTTGFIPVDTLSFFKIREDVFKRIWKNEEAWLKPRYRLDISYWKKRLNVIKHYDWFSLESLYYRSYRSNRCYLSYPSYFTDLSSRSDALKQSDLTYRSYQLYRPSWPDRSDLMRIQNQSGWTDLPFLSYQSYWSKRSNRRFLSYQSDESNGAHGALYLLIYYQMTKKKRITFSKAFKYRLFNRYETLNTSPLIIVPSLPNQIEDAVRSVEHARQFLHEGIFWRFFWHLPYYLFMIGALLILQPWLSAKSLLQLGLVILIFWFGLQIFKLEDWNVHENNWKLVHLTAYLTVPLTGVVLLLWMLWKQQQGRLFTIAVNMVFLGVLLILLGAFNLKDMNAFYQFGSPIDAAFYGAQVIGLLAACIVPYVQAMPKTR